MKSIDISSIRVWKLSLIPFGSDDRKKTCVWDLQNSCVGKNIAPIGFWVGNEKYELLKDKIESARLQFVDDKKIRVSDGDAVDKYKEIYELACNFVLNEKNEWEQKGEYKVENDTSLKDALSNMEMIKNGDYIIMRLRDGKYYIGRVSDEACFMGGRMGIESCHNISWGVSVDKYEIFTEEEIPSEISGRFSQRNQRTLAPINNVRIRLLVDKIMKKRLNEECDIPEIELNSENFACSLNYKELEDLVSLYIWNEIKSKEYFLLPSSGKINREKYEFSFYSEAGKPITCQVKNKGSINPEDYKDDEGKYAAIYLFSGIWTSVKYKDFKSDVIKLIRKQELFPSLLESYFKLTGKNECGMYKINKDQSRSNYKGIVEYFKEHCCIGDKYIEEKSKGQNWNTKSRLRYYVWRDESSDQGQDKFDTDLYVSIGERDIYYSPEFNRLIIDVEANDNNRDMIDQIIKYFEKIEI